MIPWRRTAQPSMRLIVRAILITILLSAGCQRFKVEGTTELKASPGRESNAGGRPEAREVRKPPQNGNLEVAAQDGALQPSQKDQAAVAAIQAAGGTLELDQQSPGNPVIRVDLSFTRVTDVDLGSLTRLEQLQELYLINTKVTDSGLTPLGVCSHLQTLDIAGTQVTDAALVALSTLAELKTLGLSNTKVTDAGILKLKSLRSLRLLDLSSCKVVTSAGIQQLQKSLPQAKILH
jgi:hypothetical protein